MWSCTKYICNATQNQKTISYKVTVDARLRHRSGAAFSESVSNPCCPMVSHFWTYVLFVTLFTAIMCKHDVKHKIGSTSTYRIAPPYEDRTTARGNRAKKIWWSLDTWLSLTCVPTERQTDITPITNYAPLLGRSNYNFCATVLSLWTTRQPVKQLTTWSTKASITYKAAITAERS